MWQVWTNYPVQYYSPTPLQYLPKITFGPVEHSYFVFEEYGLPSNISWAITLNGQIVQSNSTAIYGYLPYGVYVYSVGQFIANNTFSAGYVQVGSMAYIPSPQQGFLVVNSIFIVQVITFTTNKILQYQITPQLPQVVKHSNTTYSFDLPLYISNYQGLPANSSVIALIEKNLTTRLISAQANYNLTINVSNVSYGLIVIFMELNISTIKRIQNGSSVISFFSEFKYGAMIDLATGIAGSTTFSGLSSTSSPRSSNSSSSSSGNLNSLNELLADLSGSQATILGRALTIVVAALALIYYSLRIQEARKKRKKK